MFEKVSKALTRADIAEIEGNLGFPFPKDFVEGLSEDSVNE